MISTVAIVGLLSVFIYALNYWVKYYLALRRSIAEAKETGLPYVVIPCVHPNPLQGHVCRKC